MSSFRTSVEIQKANGVQLISGADSGKRATKLVNIIASTVQTTVKEVILQSSYFSMLSDGSQARKTNSEKELVMVRVVRDGVPVYHCVGLENISDYGDATAHNVKCSLDNAFQNKLKVPDGHYKNMLICATADGASVNTGTYNGVLTQLKEERPWLVTMHCVSHRVELAIKDSICKQPQFEAVKDFMVDLFYYTKRSGKFVHHLQATAEALGAKMYKFPKVHGTRFVNHQRHGVDVLLHNWIILLETIENTLASQKKQDAKLLGYRRKLKNFTFLSHCCVYQAVLEKVASLSLQFEKGSLQVFEIEPEIKRTLRELRDLQGQNPDDFLKQSGFTLHENKITCPVLKDGHKRKKPENRETVVLSLNEMTHTDGASDSVNLLKAYALPAVATCLSQRFESFQSDLFQHCHWMDPANWASEEDELREIHHLVTHFEVPLQARNFEKKHIWSEWKHLKETVETFYRKVEALAMWKKMITYRRDRFPNILLIVELVMCLGMSNSVVEGGFSHLTRMLPDTRLSMNHDTMENLLLIKLNDLVFSQSEKSQVIERSLEKFMEKRRKSKVDCDTETEIQGSETHSVVNLPGSVVHLSDSDSSSEYMDCDIES
ncbi:zinc finger protein 862-like [Liolophura sinensis]|uniref:zinc finger protein 862-like n=1 Tax=Liolophura sinensis TaxID=3198878 RepID=UPI003157FA8E